MENFKKIRIMYKKQEISRQSVPKIIKNELRSKSLICICCETSDSKSFLNCLVEHIPTFVGKISNNRLKAFFNPFINL